MTKNERRKSNSEETDDQMSVKLTVNKNKENVTVKMSAGDKMWQMREKKTLQKKTEVEAVVPVKLASGMYGGRQYGWTMHGAVREVEACRWYVGGDSTGENYR